HRSSLFPYTTLFRSLLVVDAANCRHQFSELIFGQSELQHGRSHRWRSLSCVLLGSSTIDWFETTLITPGQAFALHLIPATTVSRSEEHTSELQSREN